MNRIERVQAVIDGQPPDRAPVSFWHHFGPGQRAGDAAVEAHLTHLRTYDFDFLKVMFDLGYPHPEPIRNVGDLRRLDVLPGDAGCFAEHLAVIRALSAEFSGKVLMSTTIFNVWATLRRMLLTEAYAPGAGPSPPDDPRTRRLSEMLAEDRAAVQHAVEVVGQTLGNFTRCCIEAGADGVFLSVRDDWVDTPTNGPGTYDALIRPSDLRILAAAGEARLNMLHVCGQALNFQAFAEYPVHVLNWADRTAGPAIRVVAGKVKPAIAAGVDQSATLVRGTEQDCVDQVRDAISQAGDRPIIIAPGCTYAAEHVPAASLHAIRRAVEPN